MIEKLRVPLCIEVPCLHNQTIDIKGRAKSVDGGYVGSQLFLSERFKIVLAEQLLLGLIGETAEHDDVVVMGTEEGPAMYEDELSGERSTFNCILGHWNDDMRMMGCNIAALKIRIGQTRGDYA